MTTTIDSVPGRVASADWSAVTEQLDSLGCALMPQVLTPAECGDLVDMYDRADRFRSTVDMARYRFGSGQYRYFDRPYPDVVQHLRTAFYPQLLPIAREWATRLRMAAPWPDSLNEWMDRCRAAGQDKSTAILLRYRAGDWNALHRDLYGELYFPMQVVIGLDRPGTDYTGGEFLLVEQRPRAQSRGTVTVLPQGHALIFTTRDRPVRSARGWSASPVRHGVSTVRSGLRHALGVILHGAA